MLMEASLDRPESGTAAAEGTAEFDKAGGNSLWAAGLFGSLRGEDKA